MARVVINEPVVMSEAARAMQPVIRERLLRAMAIARSIAPKDTGAYGNSFVIQMSALSGRLTNTDPGAKSIEFGARGGANPRFRVLGRAMDAVGG